MAFYGTLGDIDLVNFDYPSIQPTLDLNFAKTKALDPRITFYRNSLATYTDDKGIVRTVPENVPRFDHDPTTGESLGLLIEESRTNLFTWGNFEQPTSTSLPIGWDGWNPSTTLRSQTLAPNGIQYAIFHGAVNQNGGGYKKDLTGLSANTTYTASFWAKSITSSELTYFTNNNARGTTTGTGDGAQNVAWFAATKVSLGASNLNGTGASGNDTQFVLSTTWKRFSRTITTDSAGSVRIIFSNNVGDTGTGNEDGGGVFMIWGAQLELGAFPTSYIPTSGSTVTRSVDVCYIDGTNFSSWYNPDEGTLGCNFIVSQDTDGSRFYVDIDNGANTNAIEIRSAESNFVRGIIAIPGSQQANIAVAAPNPGNNCNAAVAYKLNDFAMTADGQVPSLDNAGNLPGNAVTKMNIGSYEGSSHWINTSIKRILYYPKRLTNTQLQNLTA